MFCGFSTGVAAGVCTYLSILTTGVCGDFGIV
jgi:hypothetical protein